MKNRKKKKDIYDALAANINHLEKQGNFFHSHLIPPRTEYGGQKSGHLILQEKFAQLENGGIEAIRVFLDDERATPDGWIRVYWPNEAIDLLKNGNVAEISLDHDLGNDEIGTGYDVILWIEEAVALHEFIPPKINVHSANSSARKKMESGIRSIDEIFRRKSFEKLDVQS